jgi:hypothetical protein
MLLPLVHATLSNYVVFLCHHGKINVDVFTRVKSSNGLIVYNKENGTSFFTSMCNMNMLTNAKDGPCTWINMSRFLKFLKNIKNTQKKKGMPPS